FEQDASCGGVVKSCDEIDDGRLTGAAGSDKGDDLLRLYIERYVIEGVLAAIAIAERDVLQLDRHGMQLRCRQRTAGHRGNGIENGKDIIGSGSTFVESANDFGERPYRLHKLDQRDQKEKECTAIETLREHFLAAKPENGDKSR